jgi:HEAT repeat protein
VTGRTVVLWSMVVVAVAVVLLVAITALGRAARLRRRRLRDRMRDELRPTIVAVLSDPDAPPPADLPRRGRREELFDVLAFDYLAKVKGEARDALVRLLVDRGTIDAAERRLRRPGVVGRASAAELLGRCGLARSRDPLEGLLPQRSPEVRAAGVRALGRLGDSAAVEPLLGTVHARRSVPTAIVAQAALRTGPSAIPELRAAVHHADDAVRSVAVAVLGLERAVEAVPALVGVVRTDGAVAVRAHAARALGHIGDPRAVDALIDAAGDPPIAGVAATALGELGDARGVEALTALVGDERHDVATAAAIALTYCGAPGVAALRSLRAAGGPAADHAVAAIARAELAGRHRAADGEHPPP